MTHNCIKPSCSNKYEDNDPDAYYCPSCQEQNKKVAKEIDRKLANVSSERPLSALQQYEQNAINVKGFRFIPASKL